jgi:hypothetical protein
VRKLRGDFGAGWGISIPASLVVWGLFSPILEAEIDSRMELILDEGKYAREAIKDLMLWPGEG